MTILHGAAGPAGPFAIVFAETGRAGRAPGAMIARHLARRRRAAGSPPGRDRPMTARPRMTVFTCVRSGGRPKGARCLP
jgi:hypothetical protein